MKSYRAVQPSTPQSSDDFQKCTELIFKASQGDVEGVEKLLNDGVDPNFGGMYCGLVYRSFFLSYLVPLTR